MSAYQLARKWGLVPDFKPAGAAADRAESRAGYRHTLDLMGKVFEKRIRAMRRPPRPGPQPELLSPPPFPPTTGDDAADRAEAGRWALEVNEPWLDQVYFPQEAERVIWQVAADVRREWEAARTARRLARADWIRSWAPLVFYVGGGVGLLGTALVLAFALLGR